MTSSRPTPETDAHDKEHCGLVLPEFARQLERERNELREELDCYKGVMKQNGTLAYFLEQFATKEPR